MMQKNKTIPFFQYFFAAVFAVLFLFPLYVLLNTSVKPFANVSLSTIWVLELHPTLSNYRIAAKKLLPNLLNSFKMVLPVCFFSILTGSLNGYFFSKFKFKGSNVIFVLIIFGMFIPYQSILIPLVQTLNKTHLYGKLLGLILTHTIYGLPISTLMFRNYYMEVPDEIVEAGTLDSLDIWGIYRRLILPVSVPAIVVVLIWQFTSVWNDFLFAVVITQDPLIQPITVALQNLSGSQVVEWNTVTAGAVLASIPTLLVYIFFGKYFIQGLLTGSVKG